MCYQPFLTLCVLCHAYRIGEKLFCSPCDTSLGKVIDRNFDRNLITGENLDIIHTELTRNMCCYNMLIRKLYLKYGIRQSLNNRTFKFYNFVLRQKNPSSTIS